MSDTAFFAAGPSRLPTGGEARQSLMMVIASIAKTQGYDGIDASAMDYILTNMEKVLYSVAAHAHHLSVTSNRTRPSLRDIFVALQYSGPRQRPDALERYAEKMQTDRMEWMIEVDRPDSMKLWIDPFEGCLPSESEDDDTIVENPVRASDKIATRSKAIAKAPRKRRRRKRFRPEMQEVPSHLPSLPPKHTWLSTPSYPAQSITSQPPLAFLDLKVSSNRLMEVSLRGLIRATDAAILDRQVRTNSVATDEEGELIHLDSGFFTSGRPPTEEIQRLSSPSAIGAARSPNRQMDESIQDEITRNRMKKNRTLSLRLRTPSASVAAQTSPPDEKMSSSARRPSSAHRPSMSLMMAPKSALPPDFAARLRRNTMAAGPWSANSTQSVFNWQSFPTADMLSPLATPLTPGVGYNFFPPTPSGSYPTDMLSRETGHLGDESATAVGLPPVVNYKRTWYKKGSSNTSNANSSMNNPSQAASSISRGIRS